MIELYTRSDCDYCDLAKKLLVERGFDFKLYVIGTNITREEVKEKFPSATVLPVFVVDGNFRGGWAELLDYVNE